MRGAGEAGALPFTPVVILGAGRSGTNVLRDTLTALPGFATWPCDEINPIWRHGNVGWPNDELPPEAARPEVRRYIRGAFGAIWRRTGRPSFVVEKTCANSLRVPFVERVLPEARFVLIVRDCGDVIASAGRRWRGEMEMPKLPYFLAKARFVPTRDLPVHAWGFLRNRLALMTGRRKRLRLWGPRFEGLEAMAGQPVEDVCAHQWARCVGASDAALDALPPDRVFRLRYEDFVTDPAGTLTAILGFLGTGAEEDAVAAAVAHVRSSSVGNGRALLGELSPEARQAIDAPMRRHGYRAEEGAAGG